MQYCDVVTATGEYSCLQVNLLFDREISFYIITIYLPCFMIVVVSWFSFWIDHKSVGPLQMTRETEWVQAPARVNLCVTTLLAINTMMASMQSSLPPVAYTKAVDVWTGVCVIFVFSALLEYALVNYAARADSQRQQKERERRESLLLSPATASLQLELKPSNTMVGFGGKIINPTRWINTYGRSRCCPDPRLSPGWPGCWGCRRPTRIS